MISIKTLKIIVDAVVRIFDNTILGEVMATILSQCSDSNTPISNPISLQLIRSNLSIGHNYLLEYRYDNDRRRSN